MNADYFYIWLTKQKLIVDDPMIILFHAYTEEKSKVYIYI